MPPLLILLLILPALISSQQCPQHIGPPCPRYYNNSIADYTPGDPLVLPASTLSKMQVLLDKYIALVVKNFPPTDYKKRGVDCFEGTCGAAIMYLRLWRNTMNKEYIVRAAQYINQSLLNINHVQNFGNGGGFLRGRNGIYVVCSIVFDVLENAAQRDLCLKNLVFAAENYHLNNYSEYDSGHAGTVMCLTFINNYFQRPIISTETIERILHYIFEKGIKDGHDNILAWHNPHYSYFMYGQNHGTTGILSQFFRYPNLLNNATIFKYIKNTLDDFLRVQYPSGNFPAPPYPPYPDEEDVLVQWCHGSPAFIPVLADAYRLFNDISYYQSAVRAADNIWNRGLLTKGLHLCHGISGNTYMMLYFYQATGEVKYLYRAMKMQEFVVLDDEVSDPAKMRRIDPDDYLFLGSSIMSAVVIWSDVLSGDKKFHMPGYAPVI